MCVCHTVCVTKEQVKEVLDRVLSWPEDRQQELAAIALEMESEAGRYVYHLSEEEWVDLQEGIAQADRREFVSPEALAKADKRHGV
jgi:hypothetical protein